MKRIATMYKLADGWHVATRYCEYHSAEWMALTAQGFITHTVTELPQWGGLSYEDYKVLEGELYA